MIRKVKPHEAFRAEFDAMLEEGTRQEGIHPANQGEADLVRKMHSYFDSVVMPLICSNDWVYDGACTFVEEYLQDIFDFLQIHGATAWDLRKKHQARQKAIKGFLEEAHRVGAVHKHRLDEAKFISKGSDFRRFIKEYRLSSDLRKRLEDLHGRVVHEESLYLKQTLNLLFESYKGSIPRIMYVVRRAIRINNDLPLKPCYDQLQDLSDCISWYEAYIHEGHPLSPVFGNNLRGFYKVARNTESHPDELVWDAESNTVTIADRNDTVKVYAYEFQQRYRYLVFLGDIGLRGILTAFAERERGMKSFKALEQYWKTFPEDFPPGEKAIAQPY